MVERNQMIFKTLAGSRLYGSYTKDSDYDYKGIYFETLEQLLNKSGDSFRETKDSSELEMYSLNYYMKLLGNGQVIPIDMLFAPKQFWIDSSYTWELIQTNKKELISRNITPFIGYAKGQAIKYGLKGSKINTINEAIKLIKIALPFKYICDTLVNMEGIEIKNEITNNNKVIKHIIICGKSFSETTNYSLWLEPLEKLRASFGKRAELAMSEGIDLKAQYHTVRICEEAIELLTTGNITFPRPEVDILMKIRNGDYNKSALEELIEECFAKVKMAELATKLNLAPDYSIMKYIVLEQQKKFLMEYM